VAPRSALIRVQTVLRRTPGIAAALPAERAGRFALIRAQPATSDAGALIDHLRERLPTRALIGGPPAEARDLERAIAGRTPLVYALVLAVGFLLILTIVRAPLAAGVAVLLNLLATAAAFGAAKLIFQDGTGAALLGFHPQGFVDAWAPLFFFCLSFALAMDYTVFLLSSVRDEFERTHDARAALVEGLARSGRVINARRRNAAWVINEGFGGALE
jgi:RND superfamily putative drug exporter